MATGRYPWEPKRRPMDTRERLLCIMSFLVKVFFLSFWAFIFVCGTAFATDFSSTNFISRDPVTSEGGNYSSSQTFQLWSSVAQPAIGKSTSASNELRSGFLYFSVSVTPPPPPPPPPPPSSGTGSGSVTTPGTAPGGQPPGGFPQPGVPPILGPIIELITGEQAPPECQGVNRSDLNCDGQVNLRDLSILFTRPRIVTGRILSILFSDWTRRLPFQSYEPVNLAAVPPTVIEKPPQGLAEIITTFEPTTPKQEEIKPSLWKSIVQGFSKIINGLWSFILRILGF